MKKVCRNYKKYLGVANNPPKPKTFNEERQKDENSDFEIQQKINTFEMKKQSTEQKQLFVVASFVNKPANLGGLSRTCEIFNVSGLTISNLDVLNLNEFKALSMASHKNLPIIEVCSIFLFVSKM
jgi:tRNA G18 (ribose-2'-O)-methylase SpoU